MELKPNDFSSFEMRKKDHIAASLRDENEAIGQSGLSCLDLVHEALPEIDFSDIQIKNKVFGVDFLTPFLVSSMTAGHSDAIKINLRIAKACVKNGWMMAVGSQRRELSDKEAYKDWESLRLEAPELQLIGNIGLSQLIQSSISEIESLVKNINAMALFVHTNPLQECIQPEGTPQFRGGLEALRKASAQLSVPVILKETGCGFSKSTLLKLKELSLGAVDVSGFGGTHWGRIEGDRAKKHPLHYSASKTFKNWGVATTDSICNAMEANLNCEIWASGGVRNGLDAAKLIALGADVVGFAKPILQEALKSEEAVDLYMKKVIYEYKVALFCTGSENKSQLQKSKAWKWKTKRS